LEYIFHHTNSKNEKGYEMKEITFYLLIKIYHIFWYIFLAVRSFRWCVSELREKKILS